MLRKREVLRLMLIPGSFPAFFSRNACGKSSNQQVGDSSRCPFLLLSAREKRVNRPNPSGKYGFFKATKKRGLTYEKCSITVVYSSSHLYQTFYESSLIGYHWQTREDSGRRQRRRRRWKKLFWKRRRRRRRESPASPS